MMAGPAPLQRLRLESARKIPTAQSYWQLGHDESFQDIMKIKDGRAHPANPWSLLGGPPGKPGKPKGPPSSIGPCKLVQ